MEQMNIQGRNQESKRKKKFVRYDEGAELYSMSTRKFKDFARDAGAIYRVSEKLVLINTEIIDEYLEYFHVREY